MSLDYLDYKLGGENPMGNIPVSCVTCPYETSCNTAFNFEDCHFYYMRREKSSLKAQLKNLFGKLFK